MWQDKEWRNKIPWHGEPSHFDIPAGSILLFDYRLLHRGQAHTGNVRRFDYAMCCSHAHGAQSNSWLAHWLGPQAACLIECAVAHAGDVLRPLLYYTYGRRWFSDTLNFPPVSAPYDA